MDRPKFTFFCFSQLLIFKKLLANCLICADHSFTRGAALLTEFHRLGTSYALKEGFLLALLVTCGKQNRVVDRGWSIKIMTNYQGSGRLGKKCKGKAKWIQHSQNPSKKQHLREMEVGDNICQSF